MVSVTVIPGMIKGSINRFAAEWFRLSKASKNLPVCVGADEDDGATSC